MYASNHPAPEAQLILLRTSHFEPRTLAQVRLADAGALAGSGLQNALAHADEVRRGFHQLIGLNETAVISCNSP